MNGPEARSRFETDRLAFFAAEGFVGEGRRIPDQRGAATYVIVGGDGSPSRVLVHGGLSESTNWAPLAGRLTGRLVIPDRPGYGLSSPIDYRKVDDFFAAAADWLESVVDGLGEEQVDLIGNSMGGFFAVAFAARRPHRVRRLVLLGAPAGIDKHIPWFLRLWGDPILGRLFMRSTLEDPEQLRERVYSGLVAHPERVSDEQLAVEFAAGRLPDFALTSHTMLRAATSFRGWRRRYSIRDHLSALYVPTLIAWGSEDTAFSPPELGREIASKMPNGRFELLPDAGHLPWLDEPQLVAEMVSAFLED
jgi:pimeloyl-ACP methyl ester carboxylesterase